MSSATVERTVLTVPDTAEELGIRIDKFRNMLKQTPAAFALFTRVGPARAIPVVKLDELRIALGLRSAS